SHRDAVERLACCRAARFDEAAVSPAPCEEGVFYRFASACQAVAGDALHPARAPLTAHLILPRWLRIRGAYSTEHAVIVNRNVSKRFDSFQK
ncbi:MAG: hypothetical protein ACQEXC_10645, partial [Pseudomonadota bacterium]